MSHSPLPGELLAWEVITVPKPAAQASARRELSGAIQGSSCQDSSSGVFCSPYLRALQQPPALISLFLLTAYPLPSPFPPFSPRWLSAGERATPPAAALSCIVTAKSLSTQEFLSGAY